MKMEVKYLILEGTPERSVFDQMLVDCQGVTSKQRKFDTVQRFAVQISFLVLHTVCMIHRLNTSPRINEPS